MRSAWAADIEKFAPQLTYSIASAEQREDAFQLATDVVILNTDGVKWLESKAGRKYLKDFDHLIVDEGTAFKHASSQRTKAMMKLRSAFTHRYLLTGTPNPNSVTELWAPTLIVDDGQRLGTSFSRFRNSTQVPEQIGPGINHIRWVDQPGIAAAVDVLISDITIRHAFEDVMTHVPANHRDTKRFTLNKKTKAIYDKLEHEAVVALQENVVSAVHAASLRTKLLQVASGAVYAGDEDGKYEVVDRQRYDLIADLVDERDHSVVFFNWRHQRDELAATFDKRSVSFAVIDGSVPQRERDRIVADYQDGKYQTLLLHPRTGAHGLTLTRGTTTIIASPIYEADLLKQAVHRVYRGDQKKTTNTILVCASDTVEEKVYAKLFDKEARMTDLLDLLETKA